MKKILLPLLLLLPLTVFGQSVNLEFEDQVDKFMTALDQNSWGRVSRDIEFSTLRVRTVLELGLEIPYIADFKIQPEVEFYFVKK